MRCSLRFVLTALTLICMLLVWPAHLYRQQVIERRAVELMASYGAYVGYEQPLWGFRRVVSVKLYPTQATFREKTDLPYFGLPPISDGDRDVSDSDLTVLRSFFHVREIDIQYSNISDKLWANTSHLTDLRRIDCSNSRVTSSGCHALLGFENIEWLALNGICLHEAALDRIGRLRNLRTLSLCDVGLDDCKLGMLGDLPALEELYICNNPTSDNAIQHLLAMPRLQHIHTTNTSITRAGIDKLTASGITVYHNGESHE